MPRDSGRTAACSKDDARERLSRAREFIYVGDLVLGETIDVDDADDDINLSGVSTALSVLAGIASADAVTCHRLGMRSRGQAHAQALALIRRVHPEGAGLANDLDRLLDLKDNSQYGVLSVSATDARQALSWAKRMFDTAEAVVGAHARGQG